MKDNMSQQHISSLRWSILRTIMVGGHLGATEEMCLSVGRSEFIGVTKMRIRTEMDYLENRKLIELEKSEVRPWRATLTRSGRDVVDYEVDVEPGITRPPFLDPHLT